MRTFLLTTILILILTLTSSCASCPQPPTPHPQTPQPTPVPTDLDQKDFTLPSLSGESLTLSTFRGHPILLVFFTNQCPYCRKEVPALNAIFEKYQEDLIVLGMGYGEEGEIRAFVNQTGAQYPVVFFKDKTLAAKYNVYTVPHQVLFNRAGQIVYSIPGALTFENLEQLLQEILSTTDS